MKPQRLIRLTVYEKRALQVLADLRAKRPPVVRCPVCGELCAVHSLYKKDLWPKRNNYTKTTSWRLLLEPHSPCNDNNTGDESCRA